MSEDSDIFDLPFLEYARLATEKHAEKHANTGIRWLTFDELVASKMTELEIEAHYGDVIAIKVGIPRDPEDPTWWENREEARPAIEVVPELVKAHLRGDLKLPSKVDVTLTLDRDLVDHFYACGKDWRKAQRHSAQGSFRPDRRLVGGIGE